MKTILYLDDDDEDIYLFGKAINEISATLEVWYASCTKDFYNILKQMTPDLIFMDIHAGDCIGTDCLKKLRISNHWKDIPVIMYTMSSDRQSIEECYTLKANGFLTKSGDFKQIVESLKKVLDTDWQSQLSIEEDKFLLT